MPTSTAARRSHHSGAVDPDRAAATRALPRVALWFYALGAVVLGWLILDRLFEYVLAARTAAATAVGALFVAYVMYPIVRKLNVRLPLWQAIAIPYSAGALLVVVCCWFLLPRLIDDVQSLLSAWPPFAKSMQRAFEHPSNPVVAEIPAALRVQIAYLPEQLTDYVRTNTFGVLAWTVATVTSAFSIGILAIAIPVASIYMLAEAERIKRLFLGMIPERARAKTLDLLADLNLTVGGYVRGQLIVAATVGTLACGLLTGLHVPYGLLVGVWAGIADIIPYVGPFAGALPAVALALSADGLANASFVAVGFVVINQLEAHILLPRIIARTVNVTPLTVIFALIVGGELLGILGLLIAVPVVGAIRVILTHLRPPEVLSNAEVQPALTPSPKVDVDPDAVQA